MGTAPWGCVLCVLGVGTTLGGGTYRAAPGTRSDAALTLELSVNALREPANHPFTVIFVIFGGRHSAVA